MRPNSRLWLALAVLLGPLGLSCKAYETRPSTLKEGREERLRIRLKSNPGEEREVRLLGAGQVGAAYLDEAQGQKRVIKIPHPDQVRGALTNGETFLFSDPKVRGALGEHLARAELDTIVEINGQLTSTPVLIKEFIPGEPMTVAKARLYKKEVFHLLVLIRDLAYQKGVLVSDLHEDNIRIVERGQKPPKLTIIDGQAAKISTSRESIKNHLEQACSNLNWCRSVAIDVFGKEALPCRRALKGLFE